MPRYLFQVKTNNLFSATPTTSDLTDDNAAYDYAERYLRGQAGVQRVDIFRQVGAVEAVTSFQRQSVPERNPEDAGQTEGV